MKKAISIIVTALFISLLFMSTNLYAYDKGKVLKSNTKKKVTYKKTILKKSVSIIPAKIVTVWEPATEYQPGNPVEATVKCSGFNGKAQYRYSLTAGKITKELYNKSKGFYGPAVDGKKETCLSMKAFYDYRNGSVFICEDDKWERVKYEDIQKYIDNHEPFLHGRQENILTVYARAVGSKKSYDSKVSFNFVVFDQ